MVFRDMDTQVPGIALCTTGRDGALACGRGSLRRSRDSPTSISTWDQVTMQRIADLPVIKAAARLFHEHPDLSNMEALRRLAAALGSDLVLRIPINRFERQVREPALQFLREHGPEAAGPDALAHTHRSPNGSGPGSGQPDARAVEPPHRPASRRARRPGPSREPLRAERSPPVSGEVDEAIVEAFALGAAAGSRREVISSFHELDTIRRRVRELLNGAS